MSRRKRGYVARGECRKRRSCYLMGCENACCLAEHRRYVTARRVLGRFRHGSRARYDSGCRCPGCSATRHDAYLAETLRRHAW